MLDKHRVLIEKFAQNALAKSGLKNELYLEDALGEGLLAFVEALNTYDPNLGTKFSTWLWYKLQHHIGRFINEELRQQEITYVLGTGTFIKRSRRSAIRLPKRRAIKLTGGDASG